MKDGGSRRGRGRRSSPPACATPRSCSSAPSRSSCSSRVPTWGICPRRRVAAYQRDIAMRLKYGAARWRVARELLTESLLLLRRRCRRPAARRGRIGDRPQFLPAQVVALAPAISLLSGRGALLGLALTVISAAVIGLVPGRSRPANLSPRVALGRRTERHGRPRGRPPASGFIVAEVALAVALWWRRLLVRSSCGFRRSISASIRRMS